MTANISREPEYFEGIPAFLTIDKVKKCTKEAFNKFYNENFQALQNLDSTMVSITWTVPIQEITCTSTPFTEIRAGII